MKMTKHRNQSMAMWLKNKIFKYLSPDLNATKIQWCDRQVLHRLMGCDFFKQYSAPNQGL